MITNTQNYNTGKTLVFIDQGVDDYQYLQQGVISSAEAHIINQSADGIEQISQVLGKYQNIAEVHIISHGSPGCLYLGNGQLSLDTLNSYAGQLQKWNIPSLLLYGCYVAAGDAGTEFVEKLRNITGAEIAASKSLTGSAIQGGNWELEVITAKTINTLALDSRILENYASILGTLFGGGNSQWDYLDNGSYLTDASLLSTSQGDAFDNALETQINGVIFNPSTAGTVTGQTFTSPTIVMSGLNVSVQYYADPNQPVFRKFVSLQNPTASPITINYRLSNNVGSDSSTTVQATSSSDTNFTTADRWIITDDDPTAGDPTNTHVLYGLNGLAPSSVSQSVFSGAGNEGVSAEFANITIPANSTRSFLFFNGLSSTSAIAQSNVSVFNNAALQSSTLLNGLTSQQLAETLNWNFIIPNQAPTNLSLSSSSINENEAANTVVGSFSSTDPDIGNTFTYSLVAPITGTNDNNAFTINPTTGQLTINSSPNFETKSIYNIRVRTTDQGGLFFEKNQLISINNVNEQPTDLAISNSSINENVAGGSTVGTFTSTDPDTGNTFTYSLVAGTGDADNSAFTINAGQLIINNSPDFETKSSYNIRVRTTDQNNLSFEKGLTITINDITELTTNSDVWQGTATADLAEALSGNDRLYGNGGNDTLDGGDGDDLLYGGNDNDLLRGGNGIDRLYGDAGNDSIMGDAGNDILYGGTGNDTLIGGAGSDRLYGDGGNDTFVLETGMGQDTIYQFVSGTEKIQIQGVSNYAELNLVRSGTNTLIKVLETGETLGTLFNASASASDFIFNAVT